jgi:hypothetical protein
LHALKLLHHTTLPTAHLLTSIKSFSHDLTPLL